MAPRTRSESKKGNGKGKGRAGVSASTSSSHSRAIEEESDLAMSEEEMYRVIRETGILGDSFAAATASSSSPHSSSSFATKGINNQGIPRFEELSDSGEDDELEHETEDGVEEQQHEQGTPTSIDAVPILASPRRLVELIDSDEALPQSDLPSDAIDLEEVQGDDNVFRFFIWMIIFGSLWLCLDLMIHAQYGQDRSVRNEIGRAVNVLPGLAFIIYFTSTYSSSYLTKAFLLGWSTIGGSYMIHIVNNESYMQVMRRCPVLGTLWIWSIVQLDLPSAVLSLATVAVFVKYKSLAIIFPS